MKKKIIAISLITTMVICNSTTVWATDTWSNDSGSNKYTIGTDEATSANTTDKTTSGTKDVTATFGLDAVNDTYSVEISWGALVFTPTGTLSGTWVAPDSENEDGYFSVLGHSGVWEASTTDGNIIKVTNKSNVDITATFTTDTSNSNVSNYYFITPSISMDKNSLNVKSKLNLDQDETNEANTTVSVSGTITKAKDAETHDVTIGTVTVSLAKATP